MPKGEYQRTAKTRLNLSKAAKNRTPKGTEAQEGCSKNLIPGACAKMMQMTPEEWGAAMTRARTATKAIKTSLVEAALGCDLPKLYADAIRNRDLDLMDLLERALKLIGAAATNPLTANMISIEAAENQNQGPVVVKFSEAQEVKESEEPQDVGQ